MTIATVDKDDTLAVLEAMEMWLSDEGHWTWAASWRDANGLHVADRDDVVATCLTGAGAYVTARGPFSCPEGVREALEATFGEDPEDVNDSHDGYNQIMAGLRTTIARLKEEAA